jgi:hypothetical protein
LSGRSSPTPAATAAARADAPRARPQTEGAAAEFAENEILGDRQAGDSEQFGRLMNGHDARLMRRQRRGETNPAPGDDKLAGIGRNDAGGNFRQRRFARAIGPHQREDLAARDRQVDRIERKGRAIGFENRPERQGGRLSDEGGGGHCKRKSKPCQTKSRTLPAISGRRTMRGTLRPGSVVLIPHTCAALKSAASSYLACSA